MYCLFSFSTLTSIFSSLVLFLNAINYLINTMKHAEMLTNLSSTNFNILGYPFNSKWLLAKYARLINSCLFNFSFYVLSAAFFWAVY